MFVLQLWRRRDPQTGSNMPGELTFLIDGKDQPEFSISSVLNQYFYKSDDPIVTRGGVKYEATTNPETDEMELRGKLTAKQTFKFGFNEAAGSTVLLKKNKSPFPEEDKIIDQLLEDVLPHGYA
jgi:hypothetical protein